MSDLEQFLMPNVHYTEMLVRANFSTVLQKTNDIYFSYSNGGQVKTVGQLVHNIIISVSTCGYMLMFLNTARITGLLRNANLRAVLHD